MARILVTGVAGFIGAHTAQELLARGDEVVGVDVVAPVRAREDGGHLNISTVSAPRDVKTSAQENELHLNPAATRAPEDVKTSAQENKLHINPAATRAPTGVKTRAQANELHLNPAATPAPSALQSHRLAWLTAHENFTFARADIAQEGALERALPAGAFDAVLHLAARAGVRASVENPRAYLDANIGGTLAVLELCRARAIPKLVLASTSSVYGASRALPFREEQTAARPLSPYAATKQACETLAHTWHALHGLDVSVLRYFTVYGPAPRPDMAVFRFVQALACGRHITVYGDGAMSRDFSFVSDIARGTVAALRPLGYEIINLGAAAPHSVRELLAAAERHTGETARIRHAPAHAADVPATKASIEKATRLLGFHPSVSLDEGIRRTVAWYRAQESWAREVPTS